MVVAVFGAVTGRNMMSSFSVGHSVEGCRHAESGHVTLWSTAELHTVQCGGRRTFAWMSCLRSKTVSSVTSSPCHVTS